MLIHLTCVKSALQKQKKNSLLLWGIFDLIAGQCFLEMSKYTFTTVCIKAVWMTFKQSLWD